MSDVALAQEVVRTPTVTLSTLAKAMGPISPRELAGLLEGHKYPSGGRPRSYQCARKQAIDLLVDKKPLDLDAPLRTHEKDAIRALSRMTVPVSSWVRAVRPARRSVPWALHGVVVSMVPDVEIEGRRESGAVKFSFTKTPLANGVGSMMASLVWFWRKRILGIESTSREHCIVYEPRLPRTHRPGRYPASQIRSAELACKIITALWPSV